jgi:hypothetical protein
MVLKFQRILWEKEISKNSMGYEFQRILLEKLKA